MSVEGLMAVMVEDGNRSYMQGEGKVSTETDDLEVIRWGTSCRLSKAIFGGATDSHFKRGLPYVNQCFQSYSE